MKKRLWSAIAIPALLAGGASCSSNEPVLHARNDGGGGAVGSGGTIQLTASGEVLALGGYAFPPATPNDVAFVDGWEVRFDEVLTTIDKITLSENPDLSPSEQGRTGAAVARLTGPWAVDLHKGGPLAGKGGSGEQALAFGTIDNENLRGGAAFDVTQRYAFSYDLVAASASAKALNLDAAATADYEKMKAAGVVVFYKGTATFKGADCTPKTDPVLDALPKVVRFELGFATPTTYANCQNPDNDPAKPFGDEEHQRGLALKANAQTTAQVTIHTDHPFWDSTLHDSPAHFDPFAALATVGPDGTATVTLDDLKGVDFTSLKTKAGKPVPPRSCVDASRYKAPPTAALAFDSKTIAYDPAGSQAASLRDLKDYVTYNQSTQGHLNSNGLCSVTRNYPSPP